MWALVHVDSRFSPLKEGNSLKAPRFSDDMLHGYMQTYTILKMKEHYKFRHR